MSAAHTPGPWAVCQSTDARGKGYVRPIGPDATRDDGSRPAVCRIVDAGHTSDERRANERLICAAPELLELLREALGKLDVNDLDEATGLGLDAWVVQVRAVVGEVVR